MAKTTVAALAAEVETLTAQVEALAKLVQVIAEPAKMPTKKPVSRKPKAAEAKKPKRSKEANKLAHRQFLAFYGRGEAAKAKAAIPERWLAQEFYASRLAEIS